MLHTVFEKKNIFNYNKIIYMYDTLGKL